MADDQPTTRHIQHVPLDDLQADPRNPKRHADELIQESVQRLGFIEPIVVDGRTGFIISGHGRVKALQQRRDAGEAPPDGVQVGDDGVWSAPVVVGWSSASDSESAAALISLNRTTELGGWVDSTLLDLLADLHESDTGFDGVGYGENEIEILKRKVDAQDYLDQRSGADDDSWRGEAMDEFRRMIPLNADEVRRKAFHVVRIVLPDEESARKLYALLDKDYDPEDCQFWWPHGGRQIQERWED